MSINPCRAKVNHVNQSIAHRPSCLVLADKRLPRVGNKTGGPGTAWSQWLWRQAGTSKSERLAGLLLIDTRAPLTTAPGTSNLLKRKVPGWMGAVPSRTRERWRENWKTVHSVVGSPAKRTISRKLTSKCANFMDKAAKLNNTMMPPGCKEEEGGVSIFF